MKRLISILLLLALLVPTLAACGKTAPVSTTSPDAEATATEPGGSQSEPGTTVATATAGPDKWETIAPKILALAARDRQLTI